MDRSFFIFRIFNRKNSRFFFSPVCLFPELCYIYIK